MLEMLGFDIERDHPISHFMGTPKTLTLYHFQQESLLCNYKMIQKEKKIP
jgi:hypothetical protein